MEFSKEHTQGNVIDSVTESEVVINGKHFSSPILVSPDTIIEEWQAIDFKSFKPEWVETIASLKPELVILATGQTHQNLAARYLQYFYEKSLAPECMSTNAACRTYNVLINEGRRVVLSIQF